MKKKILIGIIGLVVIAIGVVCLILLLPKDETYRSIKVFKIEGTVEVSRNSEVLEAYEQMMLKNNDEVSVGENESLILKLDSDKYICLDENTKIKLISSEKDSSKTVIELKEGKIIGEVKEKLKDDETFEVETPNSVMAIRGTTFSVEVDEEPKEYEVTYQVVDGVIEVLIFDQTTGSTKVNSVSIESEECAKVSVDKSAYIDSDTLKELKDQALTGDISVNEYDSVDNYINSSDEVVVEKGEYEDSDFDGLLDLTEYNYRIITVSSSFSVKGTNITGEHLYENSEKFTAIITADEVEGKVVNNWLVNGKILIIESVDLDEVPSIIELEVNDKLLVEVEYKDIDINCEHDFQTEIVESTCTKHGTETSICSKCGEIESVTELPLKDHLFGEWHQSKEYEDKHERVCKCGEVETGNCTFDEGKVTKEPTHTEEGIKTYTCTECGRIKEEPVEKTEGHEFGEWIPDEVEEDKHYRECLCGELETDDCEFVENSSDNGLIIYSCTICGREKETSGITIVVYGGTATFEGKETVKFDTDKYGEKANVYIAQANDVLNVSLTNQEGRTFKHWVSATGTIIPDEEFSMLVLRSGYYYPVFEDTDLNDFSNREKIFEGNCEEGTLYMSTNSKGDVKYELEFETGGYHASYETTPYNSQYHKHECSVCGEVIYEKHEQMDSEVIKPSTHTEEGQIKYECNCGYEWYEVIPTTEEHTIDYDEWNIIEKSENGEYGKYRVHCQYCDYYEEYWYLNNDDLSSFLEGKMINYQYTYGGKVCHDEYYYSYTNEKGEKVYIWAIQYESERTSNKDNNDTYIFMYIDDEDSTTIEPIYLSKSRGDKIPEYLWAIYGYAYDVNDWIKTLDSPDYNIGCGNGMLLSNSMSARSSVFESYHNYWAETYNDLRIPTSKEYNDLSNTSWEISYEGKAFQGGYYDENEEYVTTGGRDIISYVKDFGTSYQKYMHVDKETGITYGYEDLGTYYRTIFIMRTCKEIVSPKEFEKLDEAGKSVVYSYGDIEKDIKSLCSKRIAFNNFTLTLPETTTAFRFLFGDYSDNVEVSYSNTNEYYNNAHVYNSGYPITLTWQDNEGVAFDRYEIWDFESQTWVTLSESPTYTFNTSTDPVRDAVYARVIYHEADVPIEPGETYRVTVENGYFYIDGEEYTGTIEVVGGTTVNIYSDYIEGKTFEYWLDGDGNQYNDYSITINSDMILTAVYTDATYNVYVSGWDYNSYVSVNGGEQSYTGEFNGKVGDKFELSSFQLPDSEYNVFMGWYIETNVLGSWEYLFLSETQTFTYEITGKESGSIYGVWTTGENPFTKKYVDIRMENGFVTFGGGEASTDAILENAYSVISVSRSGRATFFDDPTDETYYKAWDVAFRYEIDGEINHNFYEEYSNEYDFYPAACWIDNPEYSYPEGVINVSGYIITEGEGSGEVILPS